MTISWACVSLTLYIEQLIEQVARVDSPRREVEFGSQNQGVVGLKSSQGVLFLLIPSQRSGSSLNTVRILNAVQQYRFYSFNGSTAQDDQSAKNWQKESPLFH